MFEFHEDSSRQEVAALFGDGVESIEGLYVEDAQTGDLLASAGLLGRGGDGRTYLLRWRGRTLGLHSRVVTKTDETGVFSLFTLEALGTSIQATFRTHLRAVELEQEDEKAASRVAAEACLVLESHLKTLGSRVRVKDPDGSGRELSPADYDYPDVMARDAAMWTRHERRGDPGDSA